MAVEHWCGLKQMVPANWTCGHCNCKVGGNRGYFRNDGGHMPSPGNRDHPPNQPGGDMPSRNITEKLPRIFICPSCDRPTYFEEGMQIPGVTYGVPVGGLPPEVGILYDEARNCMQVSAFTASALVSRKLLMNVAVSRGAAQNQSFQFYVDYLANNGILGADSKPWVDRIRTKGNEATHEIPAVKERDAQDLIVFMEILLKLVFEFPSLLSRP